MRTREDGRRKEVKELIQILVEELQEKSSVDNRCQLMQAIKEGKRLRVFISFFLSICLYFFIYIFLLLFVANLILGIERPC